MFGLVLYRYRRRRCHRRSGSGDAHIEHGMSQKDATIQAMKEVSALVIGIALSSRLCSFLAFLAASRTHTSSSPYDRYLRAALGFQCFVASAGALRHVP
jgi:hypothetical protein